MQKTPGPFQMLSSPHPQKTRSPPLKKPLRCNSIPLSFIIAVPKRYVLPSRRPSMYSVSKRTPTAFHKHPIKLLYVVSLRNSIDTWLELVPQKTLYVVPVGIKLIECRVPPQRTLVMESRAQRRPFQSIPSGDIRNLSLKTAPTSASKVTSLRHSSALFFASAINWMRCSAISSSASASSAVRSATSPTSANTS